MFAIATLGRSLVRRGLPLLLTLLLVVIVLALAGPAFGSGHYGLHAGHTQTFVLHSFSLPAPVQQTVSYSVQPTFTLAAQGVTSCQSQQVQQLPNPATAPAPADPCAAAAGTYGVAPAAQIPFGYTATTGTLHGYGATTLYHNGFNRFFAFNRHLNTFVAVPHHRVTLNGFRGGFGVSTAALAQRQRAGLLRSRSVTRSVQVTAPAARVNVQVPAGGAVTKSVTKTRTGLLGRSKSVTKTLQIQ